MSRSALIIVDVQNDFCEGGSLEVPGSLSAIRIINKIRAMHSFDLIVCTKDYHPQTHVSFAQNHINKDPFTTIALPNGKLQELWPVHCVADSHGSELHVSLVTYPSDKVILKGRENDVDSYSGFGSIGEHTGLLEFLHEHRISTIFICGLAYDFCVGSTALDSAANGFTTYIIANACGTISKESSNAMNGRLEQYSDILFLIDDTQIADVKTKEIK